MAAKSRTVYLSFYGFRSIVRRLVKCHALHMNKWEGRGNEIRRIDDGFVQSESFGRGF